jgi:hypothetical protein
MANSALQGNIYNIDQEFQGFLGKHMSYEALKMRESRLSKAKDDEDFDEYERLGGEATHDYIKAELKTERDSVYNPKKIGMDTGRKNQFIRAHEKDKKITNVTDVSTGPKMNKGSINRKIMSNKEVYNEELSPDANKLNKEISSIKYLIEYMNNKNKIL